MQIMKRSIRMSVMMGLFLMTLPLLAADDEGYALLIQQSPPDGGVVTPGNGVHRASIGDTVSISAMPKPGYRFMYWLGDVADSGSGDTTIAVDSPKMVVAVFAREDHEDLPGIGITDGVNAEGGAGGGRFAASPVMAAASVSPASTPDYDYDDPYYPPLEDEEKDVPVPSVPEPATMLLLGLGAVLGLRRK